MSTDTANGGTTKTAATKLEFVQYHQPPLSDGDYQVTLTQTVKIRGEVKPPFSTARKFTVQGPRCVLDPSDVHAVFPPEGSLGEHSNVLPHVVLNRSTLPWERRAYPDRNDLPWLAVLLFDEAEKPEPASVSLASLRSPSTASPWWPGLAAETGEDPNMNVSVIDVPKGLLLSLLPVAADLPYLSHVRRGVNDQGQLAGAERAVVIGNRLPAPGAISAVHLVSLDRRFSKDPQTQAYGFDFQASAPGDSIRLISLKSWSFASVDLKQQFKHLLKNLDPYHDGQPTGRPATLQLPPSGNALADAYLSLGYVPLSHALREGSTTVSWYHGPLVPWDNTDTVALPVRAGDELVRYDPANGFFDVSYAAAWELGRLLTLQSKQASTSLYAWKRGRVQQLLQAEQHVLHLPFAPKEVNPDDLEDIVDAWFDGLNLLRGVPYNYLVPDDRMLPAESIRFFFLDAAWVDCLLDGAFSIGRVTKADLEREGRFTDAPAKSGFDKLTGFLLCSDVVSGWPSLEVTAQIAGHTGDVAPLRMDRLSPNLLFCLFLGQILSISIHEKPDTLHFGLDPSDNDPKIFHKKLRDATGVIPTSGGPSVNTIPMRDQPRRIIDIAGLAAAIRTALVGAKIIPEQQPLNSASFALQTVEGVETVVFATTLA